ncbi:hypothetical protein B0H17DRAFT_1260845 [Mycena rosella]|uniref:Uncharacterized protein n=1 Tax=Mycena rosella TaxID=1033263 RepID=A0AAD7CSA0_MYCRO|nr:hypothetical protein B0H17DRAFT_1260845 [Mycena rosella]
MLIIYNVHHLLISLRLAFVFKGPGHGAFQERRGASAVTHPIPSDDDAKWDLWSRAFERLVFLKCMPHSCFSQGHHDASVASNLRDSIISALCFHGTFLTTLPVHVSSACVLHADLEPICHFAIRHGAASEQRPRMAPASKSKHAFRTPPRDPGQAEAAERPPTVYVPLCFLNSDFPAQSGESPAAIGRESAGTARTTGAQVGVKPTTRGARFLRFPRGGLWCWSGLRISDSARTDVRQQWDLRSQVLTLPARGAFQKSAAASFVEFIFFFTRDPSDLPARPLLLSTCKVRAANLFGTASDLRILLLSSQAATSSYAGATRLLHVLRGCYAAATRVLRGATSSYANAASFYSYLRAPTSSYTVLRTPTPVLRAATSSYAAPTPLYQLLHRSTTSTPLLRATTLFLQGSTGSYGSSTSSYELLRRNPNPTTRLYALLRGCYASATTCYAVAMRVLRGCYASATLLLWSAPEMGTFATMLRALRAPTSAPEWAQGLLM